MLTSLQVYVQGLSRFRPFSIACAEDMRARGKTKRKKSIVMHVKAISERKYPLIAVKDPSKVHIVHRARYTRGQIRSMRVKGDYGILPLGLPHSQAEQNESKCRKPESSSVQFSNSQA